MAGCSSRAQAASPAGFVFNNIPPSHCCLIQFSCGSASVNFELSRMWFCLHSSPQCAIKPSGLQRKGTQLSVTFHFIRSLNTQSTQHTFIESLQLIKGLGFPWKPAEGIDVLKYPLSLFSARIVCSSFLSFPCNSPALSESNIAASCGSRLKEPPLTSTINTYFYIYGSLKKINWRKKCLLKGLCCHHIYVSHLFCSLRWKSPAGSALLLVLVLLLLLTALSEYSGFPLMKFSGSLAGWSPPASRPADLKPCHQFFQIYLFLLLPSAATSRLLYQFLFS